VQPLQWIARMDFNSGWMLPNAEGIAKALKTVSEWSADERQALLDKALPILQREFSNEAIVDAWGAICDIVKAALATDYKAEELQVSTLRRRFLQAAARARKRIALLDALQSEVDVLLDDVKRKWTIKTVGQELSLISAAAAPNLLAERQE
jgi:hypothetical protein